MLARRPAITPDCRAASPLPDLDCILYPHLNPLMSNPSLSASLVIDFSALDYAFKDGLSPYEKATGLVYQYGTAGFRMK